MNSPSNPLTNVLTPQIRAILYAVLFVAALVFAAWQAADGDWLQFAGGVITSLLGATAASNASWTQQEPEDDGVYDEEPAVAPTPEEEADLPTDSVHGGSEVGGTGFGDSNDYGYQPRH